MTINEKYISVIRKNLFDEFAHARNTKDGKAFNLTIKGKTVKKKQISEVLEFLFSEASSSLSGLSWYQDIVSEIGKIANEERKEFREVWFREIGSCFKSFIYSKTEARDNFIKASLPSAFGAEFRSCTFKPNRMFNAADMELIKGIEYCEKNANFYFNNNGNYSIIGDVTELTDKKSAGICKLVRILNKMNGIRVGKTDYDMWAEMYAKCDRLTDEFFDCSRTLEVCYKEKKLLGDAKIQTFWMKEEMPLSEFLHVSNDKPLDDKWNDALHSAFAKAAVNHIFPAMLLNADLANLNYESSDDGFFKRYAFRQTHGRKCSFATYLTMLFEESAVIINNIPHISVEPKIISDIPGDCCEFCLYPEWKNDLKDQYSSSECKILKTFLEKYLPEERKAIMAWAYTALHPSCGDAINFLFKTGGGTFKTNYYAFQIERLLNLMYRPTHSLVQTLERDGWVHDPAQKENADGTGISTAALVVNDEATDKCMEEFKAMSGGSQKDGTKYTRRVMRENPTKMVIYCKWLFASNIDFIIQDDSGAFDRRLFIIDRMDIKKLKAPYQPNDYRFHAEKETLAFYDLAKRCYEDIKTKHGSLTNFVTKERCIAKNLTNAYKEEDKVKAYDYLMKRINCENTEVIIPAAKFTAMVKEIAYECELNEAGLRKWIKTTTSCTGTNDLRILKKIDGKITRCVKLYPLIESYRQSVDDEQDNCTYLSTGEIDRFGRIDFDTIEIDTPVNNDYV